MDIYCNSCASEPPPRLLPAIVAAIVICVLLADMVHACFFVRKNGVKIGSSKAWWILACVMLGPLVWPLWWCRQRALREEKVNAPLLTSGCTESEACPSFPVRHPPDPSAPPLEDSLRLSHNVFRHSHMILASAPAADVELYVGDNVAVAQPVSPHAGRALVVVP